MLFRSNQMLWEENKENKEKNRFMGLHAKRVLNFILTKLEKSEPGSENVEKVDGMIIKWQENEWIQELVDMIPKSRSKEALNSVYIADTYNNIWSDLTTEWLQDASWSKLEGEIQKLLLSDQTGTLLHALGSMSQQAQISDKHTNAQRLDMYYAQMVKGCVNSVSMDVIWVPADMGAFVKDGPSK